MLYDFPSSNAERERSMSRYKSLGTLRYNLSSNDGKMNEKVIFTPTADYSIKHNGHTYAIFISDALDAKLKKYKPEKHVGVELSIKSKLVSHHSRPLQAVHNQARVEIEVKTDGSSSLKLVGLTMPAK